MIDPVQKITKRADGRVRVQTINEEPSKTQQQFKDECDINNIVKKFSTTGEFTHLTSKEGRYADFSQITDYRDMLDTVLYAQEAFASLPADVRLRFQNNPAELLEFVQNPKNYDEGVKLGLVQPRAQGSNVNTNDLNDLKTTEPKAQKTKSQKTNDSTPASPE
ncbi:MAG: internal scaffolding protein [Microviridae sp.]|nr:MAG: internal scaffolding protein [Microviridae sp.]